MLLADGPEIEDAVRLAVAGDEGNARRSPRHRLRAKMSSSMRVWPWPASPVRPTISPLAGLKCRPLRGWTLTRLVGGRVAPLGAYVLARLRAHGRDQRVAGEVADALRSATVLPSFITTMRSAVDRISPSRCEIRMMAVPRCGFASHIGQELLGGHGIERGGRLIEDDKAQRIGRHREGAGDLGHLALADGEVGDLVVGTDAMAGENLVELGADQCAGARLPADALEAAVHDADVLGDRQVGAERKFLEHAADAAGVCAAAALQCGIVVPANGQCPGARA